MKRNIYRRNTAGYCRFADCPNARKNTLCQHPWTLGAWEDWNPSCSCEITCEPCRTRLGWVPLEQANASKEKLRKYLELREQDPLQAQRFLNENLHDEIFAACADVYNNLIPAFLKAVRESSGSINSAINEEDPKIREAMIESVITGSVLGRVVELMDEELPPD